MKGANAGGPGNTNGEVHKTATSGGEKRHLVLFLHILPNAASQFEPFNLIFCLSRTIWLAHMFVGFIEGKLGATTVRIKTACKIMSYQFRYSSNLDDKKAVSHRKIVLGYCCTSSSSAIRLQSKHCQAFQNEYHLLTARLRPRQIAGNSSIAKVHLTPEIWKHHLSMMRSVDWFQICPRSQFVKSGKNIRRPRCYRLS